MELGEKLKQARLEAGLSQRQLCQELITRNMLSQIENGSARPSMDTLRALAQRLGKPLSYFLEEESVSVNQSIILRARTLSPREALALLEEYRAPDPVFDPERYLLEATSCIRLAREAIGENRMGYAIALLTQAQEAGGHTLYYTPELERSRLLLCYAAGMDPQTLLPLLPDSTEEFLLRAQAEFLRGDLRRCAQILEVSPQKTAAWHFLRAETYFAQQDYGSAAQHYLQAEQTRHLYARLEDCYRELGDFQNAYLYACKQR